MKEIWQEADCHAGDVDLMDDEMVYFGKPYMCLRCSVNHEAGIDAKIATYFIDENDDMIYRGLPKDAEELAAWRAEVKPDLLPK